MGLIYLYLYLLLLPYNIKLFHQNSLYRCHRTLCEVFRILGIDDIRNVNKLTVLAEDLRGLPQSVQVITWTHNEWIASGLPSKHLQPSALLTLRNSHGDESAFKKTNEHLGLMLLKTRKFTICVSEYDVNNRRLCNKFHIKWRTIRLTL